MKRFKFLFDRVCAFDNLLLAARKARRGKRLKPATARFEHRIEEEILRLQDELSARTYRPGPFKQFTVFEPKERLISAAPYRDRVVHHALCNVIEPIYEKVFISDSYACRAGKGTHAAVGRLSQFMQGADYVLKVDIRKYFPSVDHSVLKTCIRRKIGCPGALWLVDLIIDHVPKNSFQGGPSTGLPLGNQTSQFLANVYLDPLDHFIKERMGFKRYVRYVDDLVLLGDDKRELAAARDSICDYIGENLKLSLHPKKRIIMPVSEGIDFLGYRVYPTHRLIRRGSVLRFSRRLRLLVARYCEGDIDYETIRTRIASWQGHAKHADSNGLMAALLGQAAFSRA